MPEPPWPPLVRALSATAGRAAVQRALPLYLGVIITASVLLEGSGVRPADVVASALERRDERLLLYAAWIVVSLPALRALLTTPSSFFLRTLPLARWRVLAVQCAGVLVAEAPWAYLWLRGGGFGVGTAAVAAAVAGAALVLSGVERASERVAALVLVSALCVGCDWPLLLGLSAPIAGLGVRRVWLRAPELRGVRRARSWVGGPPVVGLASSYCLVLWRQARAQWIRAAGLALLALVAAYFAVKNTRPASADQLLGLSLSLLSPALILGGAALSGPLLRIEAQLGWLLAVSGVSQRTEQLARLTPLALSGLSLASLHAGALGLGLAVPLRLGLLLLLLEAAAAVLLSLLVLGVARWAIRGDGSDASRLLFGVGGLLLGAIASLVWFGSVAVLGWAPLAALAASEQRPKQRLALALGSRLER
jgi:hypothetical protein